MAAIIAAPNETRSSTSRMTREGRKITYQMNVIQQPERARACGSGAKSSADRRPVDPPPIVELRVFEGDGTAMNEITFSYSANFFLFATLENARAIAQGRVPQNQANCPVLTGMPVAGIAYLDRPSPAGYFIFPDLSVRHEGKYRLSFQLYEELKEEKDDDAIDPSSPSVAGGCEPHVSPRLEVKSAPFIVYSAKKFPGLAESTALSRMVADQGCRVRIRRDVRMRRRESKNTKDWDDYEEDAAYEQARRTATPDAYGQPAASTPKPSNERPRSASNASNVSFHPTVQPRTSMPDLGQAYHQPTHAPPPVAAQPPQSNYPPQLNYGPAPTTHYQPPPYMPQHAMGYPPPPPPPVAPYQHPSGYPPQSSMSMHPTYGYVQPQHYQQPQYDHGPPVRHENLEYPPVASDHHRRASVSYMQPYQHQNYMMQPYSPMEYGRPSMMQYPEHPPPPPPPAPSSAASAQPLPPLRSLQPPMEKLEPTSPVTVVPLPPMPPVPIMPVPSFYDAFKNEPPMPLPQAPGGKRSFGSVFNTTHMDQPLRGGARPNVSQPEPSYANTAANDDDDDDDSLEPDALKMHYRRADGTAMSRRVPRSS